MSESNPNSNYDRLAAALEGLPDALKSRPSTVRQITPLVNNSETFIVSTVRHKETGDFIFIETISAEHARRLVLPPRVADAIARQRESLTATSRSRAAKRVAEERMSKGIRPAFLSGEHKKGGKKTAKKKR